MEESGGQRAFGDNASANPSRCGADGSREAEQETYPRCCGAKAAQTAARASTRAVIAGEPGLHELRTKCAAPYRPRGPAGPGENGGVSRFSASVSCLSLGLGELEQKIAHRAIRAPSAAFGRSGRYRIHGGVGLRTSRAARPHQPHGLWRKKAAPSAAAPAELVAELLAVEIEQRTFWRTPRPPSPPSNIFAGVGKLARSHRRKSV